MKLARQPLSVLLLLAAIILSSLGALFAPAMAAAALPLVDDFESGLPAGADADGNPLGFNTFQDPNPATSISITTTTTPPVASPGAGSTVLKMDMSVVSYAGFTHSFESAALDQWVTQDWSAYAGLSFWLYGNNSGTTLFVDVLDNRNPGSVKDDAERWSADVIDNFSGWKLIELPFDGMHRKEIGNGAPNDGFGLDQVHGWALGAVTTTAGPQTYYVDDAALYGVAPVRPLTVGFTAIRYPITEGGVATVTAKLSKASDVPVTVDYASVAGLGTAVPNRDFTPVAGTLTFAPGVTQQSFTVTTFDDAKYQGEHGLQVELSNPTGGASMGVPPVSRVAILDNEPYDVAMVDDFQSYPYLWSADGRATLSNPEIAAGAADAIPGQGAYERVLQVAQPGSKGKGKHSSRNSGGVAFGRDFPIGQDWSSRTGVSFWYQGQGTGKKVEVRLTNSQANLADPSKYRLVWRDEFNGRAGTPPDASVWGNEVGDGVAIGNPGWGNDELQYYTAGGANAATDGRGNLAITVKPADGSLQCYYGPCQYTSARLLSKGRFELAYGRVEARVKVPTGAGYWPAFWMLGTDIDQVSWPQTGEIDIMENVGRLPNQIFGTLHGPGYAGGQSYGNFYDFPGPVADAFHTFAVEWQPDRIVWYVDGIKYHEATPNDAFLQGKEWVYNHPFFMLLNVAVGGNFGGAVGADTVFPQRTLVDYVRLYQARPRTAEFQATFRDNFTGWQKIELPFEAFAGKRGTALDLAAVTGIHFETPSGARGPVRIDQLHLEGGPPLKTQMDLPVSFDSPTVNYGLVGFGGAEDATIVSDPAGGVNQVAKVVKSATAELWAGTTLTADGTLGFANKIPFTASATAMTVRVYSPDAGIQVRLKVEDHSNGGVSVETEATTTVANAWETLTFNFANPAAGTAALNLANTYDKASIFFNFGTTGAAAGAKTYYFDDVAFGGSTGGGGGAFAPITFDDSALTYTLTGFGGADASTVVADPTDAANQVAQVIKSGTAELWAGTTVSTLANFAVPTLPFSATSTQMTVRVYSPDAGIPVRLKVEDAADNTHTVETEATTTVANGWETLTFDFASPASGTAALNLAFTYNKVSIFFNFGTTGAAAGEKTYYFDDVAFGL
ncbi:family 16 glycosylhydrolase [Oscillochloris sp. ZM17-4]|uniref:carbohydrate binding domain-containing protein n=1 Tax=Oscillochloris sp. ZM17-4 TaxID=2866714 RepID=UPI001C732480|nr:carbohydrate binding domain-containing protein [Oscillochloris sp. ZM17-4]MBX0329808.1 family 16 glycosylhydrolase [Oscillochloris sp. ZM17-4]